MKQRKEQRPGKKNDFSDGMKLHLHLVTVQGVAYHVITPRPGTNVRFSTNFYHDAWHVISDPGGAKFLSRLLWGLSYQRQPNTVIFLGGEFLAPTPFDAEPSDPILITMPSLTPLNEERFRLLRMAMEQLASPTKTVRWQTRGLEQVDLDLSPWRMPGYWSERERLERRERMVPCGGMVCFSAPDLILRQDSISLIKFHYEYGGMDYLPLAPYKAQYHGGDGEIQCFRDYRQMLRDAEVARREVEAEQGDVTCFEEDRVRVQQRALSVRERRKDARRKQLTRKVRLR